MAVRMRKTHQDWPFYVYEILDADGKIVYIGKGSASRMAASKRKRGGVAANEVARFKDEEDSYEYEMQRIAEFKPVLNKALGGNGSRAGFVKGASYTKDDILMRKIGTRAFAARMLLGYHSAYRSIVSNSDILMKHLRKAYSREVVGVLESLNIDRLKEVAYGQRI